MPITATDIPEKEDKFLTRNELEKIKLRVQRIPYGEYKDQSGKITCRLTENGKTVKTIQLAQTFYPGITQALIHMKEDFENLIRHVEAADEENDFLLGKIEILKKKAQESAKEGN